MLLRRSEFVHLLDLADGGVLAIHIDGQVDLKRDSAVGRKYAS
jgi:hypothetical protein